jgi:hypothetical protein
VHARVDEAGRLPERLRAWASAQEERPSAADAVDWPRSEHPGLLRAWLLSRSEDLVAAELRDGAP